MKKLISEKKSSLIFILWKFYQKYVLVRTNKVSKMYKDYIHDVFISYSFAIFESFIFFSIYSSLDLRQSLE